MFKVQTKVAWKKSVKQKGGTKKSGWDRQKGATSPISSMRRQPTERKRDSASKYVAKSLTRGTGKEEGKKLGGKVAGIL